MSEPGFLPESQTSSAFGRTPPSETGRVTDETFQIIRERIVRGELGVGDRIDIGQLVAELGVSRTPVREAILQLETLGLVERQPYRGTIVVGLDPRRLAEVSALRIELEGLAAELGAPRLRDEDVVEMGRILDEIDARGADPDFTLAVFNELNRRFHTILVEAAAAPVLIRIVNALAAETDRLRFHRDFDHAPSAPHHRAILDACARRDGAAARELMRQHILDAQFSASGTREVGDGVLAAVLRDTGIRPEDLLPSATRAGGEG